MPREDIVAAIKNLIDDPEMSPAALFDTLLAASYRQNTIFQKSRALLDDLSDLQPVSRLSDDLRQSLSTLRDQIDRLLAGK